MRKGSKESSHNTGSDKNAGNASMHTQEKNVYLSFVESTTDSLYLVDRNCKYIFLNNNHLERLGLSKEEAIGRSYRDYHPPAQSDEFAKSIEEVFTTGKSLQREFKSEKDGRNFLRTFNPVKGAGSYGSITAVAVASKDITELKKSEVEELYKTLAESSLAAVFIVQDGKFVFINTSAIASVGYTAEELIGQGSDVIVHPADREIVRIKSREMLAGKSNQAFEFRMLTKQKETRWISQTVTPIQYKGNPAILGNAIDVTDLKLAEEALRESEQRLHDIIDFLPDATYAIDRERRVIAWNRAIEEMTGIKAPDMLGKGNYEYALPFYGMRKPVLIDLVFLSDKEIRNKYSHVTKEGDALIAEASVPLRGGNPRALWGIARPLYDSKGNIVGAIESIRDVSERKQMEETVKWLAFHDGLTGLPNRRLFSDRLTMALAHVRRTRKKLGVMILDLDKFKHINDALGHPVGDRLLRVVGERLTKILRKEDTVARMGGDEFILLLPEISRADDVILVAERILALFTEPVDVDGHELHVTTSIGFALYPENGEDGDSLIKNADIALYVAKDRGRNRYEGFLPLPNTQN
jgi:diguanylate cyclase (GGDEF)-like protein/PAS domain S-box-containing protein